MKRLTQLSFALNIFILLLLVYLIIFGRGHVQDLMRDNVLSVLKQQRYSMFRATPITPGATIFLGNSITEGARWHEFFPNEVVLNRGISGDITESVLNRISEVTRHQPKKLFICIGTNDLALGVSIDEVLTNYKAILRTVNDRSSLTKIYVQSVLPVGREVLFGHKLGPILELNEGIKQMCEEMDLTYLDIHTEFADEDDYLASEYTNDDLHLMGAAYVKWVAFLRPFVVE